MTYTLSGDDRSLLQAYLDTLIAADKEADPNAPMVFLSEEKNTILQGIADVLEPTVGPLPTLMNIRKCLDGATDLTGGVDSITLLMSLIDLGSPEKQVAGAPSTPYPAVPGQLDAITGPALPSKYSIQSQHNQQNHPVVTVVDVPARAHKPATVTDQELAEMFIARTGVRQYNGELYLYNSGIYHKLSDQELLEKIQLHLTMELAVRGHASQLQAIKTLLQSNPYIAVAPETTAGYLCLENGVLNLDTFGMIQHTPGMFFTWKLKANFFHQPPAHPNFDRFLLQVTGGDFELIQRFWEAIGYIFAPDNNAKKFVLLEGVSNSGKSVLAELISRYYDESVRANLDFNRLGARFDASVLVGKAINISSDLPSGPLNEAAVAIVKQITGRDPITVEAKYRTPITYRYNGSLVFSTNSRLTLTREDPAFDERVLWLPFRFAVPKEQQDPYLVDRLWAERDGIVSQALLAYRQVRGQNYRFTAAEQYTYSSRTTGFGSEEDFIAEFLQQECSFCTGAFTPTADLHIRYLDYCQGQGVQGLINRTQFSRRLGILCGSVIRSDQHSMDGKTTRGYIGIALRQKEA